MHHTASIGLNVLLAATFLLAGYVIGVRYANSQRPQPCVKTYMADEHLYCQLDPRDGSWVK